MTICRVIPMVKCRRNRRDERFVMPFALARTDVERKRLANLLVPGPAAVYNRSVVRNSLDYVFWDGLWFNRPCFDWLGALRNRVDRRGGQNRGGWKWLDRRPDSIADPLTCYLFLCDQNLLARIRTFVSISLSLCLLRRGRQMLRDQRFRHVGQWTRGGAHDPIFLDGTR